MKYTIAVAALLGKTNALAPYGTLITAYGTTITAGFDSKPCQDVMRGLQTDLWHYWSKRLYQDAAATKTIDSIKAEEFICSKTTATVDECSKAWTTAAGPPKTVTIKAGYAYIKNTVAAKGNPIMGAHACPQQLDTCPGARLRTIAEGKGATATEIKMKLTAIMAGGCSYLIEAQCDAPYVAIKTSADYTAGQYTGTTWSVVEYDSSL